MAVVHVLFVAALLPFLAVIHFNVITTEAFSLFDMSAASSDIIEKYLLSLISCDKLLSMIAPTVVIISFWMVLEIYVAFLGALSRWCCSVWSPLSTRNSNSAWKLPERLAFCGSSSRLPPRAMLFFPQKITVLKRDLMSTRSVQKMKTIWQLDFF